MIAWTKQFHSGPPNVWAYLGPFLLEVVANGDSFYCRATHIHKGDVWGEPCVSIESGKAACEAKAIEWIRAERDELNEALRALGVEP